MPNFNVQKLRFAIFPTRFPQFVYHQDYQKAYQCWREVWDQALKHEMNVQEFLHSDNFTRQSHVAVLFYDNQPAALVTLNYLDLADQVAKDDSYFNVWPEISMEKLKKEGRRVVSCCNVTVNFQFRRGALGISWKDLLFAILVLNLKNSSHDVMVATARSEKGIPETAYRTGAIAIAKQLPYHPIPGQIIDLVCWSKNLDLQKIDPQILQIAQYTWMNSTFIIDNANLLQGDKNAA